MPALPTDGGDSGVWGAELNAFLGVSLDAAGFLKTRARNQAWMPTGGISETVDRSSRMDVCGILQTGRLHLSGGCLVPANVTVTNITFCSSSTAAGTPTNWWFCLVDQSLNILGKTADQTTTAWATNTAKTLALTSTYTPTVDTAVYCGVMVKATTVPTFVGSVVSGGGSGVANLAPAISGLYTTSLDTPASLTVVNNFAAGDLAYANLS